MRVYYVYVCVCARAKKKKTVIRMELPSLDNRKLNHPSMLLIVKSIKKKSIKKKIYVNVPSCP